MADDDFCGLARLRHAEAEGASDACPFARVGTDSAPYQRLGNCNSARRPRRPTPQTPNPRSRIGADGRGRSDSRDFTFTLD